MLSKVNDAYWVTVEDCQGNKCIGYWCSTFFHGEKCVGQGHGTTKEQAEQDARTKLAEFIVEKNRTPQEQLLKILEKKYLLSNDMEEAIRLLARLILDVPHVCESPVLQSDCSCVPS